MINAEMTVKNNHLLNSRKATTSAKNGVTTIVTELSQTTVEDLKTKSADDKLTTEGKARNSKQKHDISVHELLGFISF